MEKYFLPILIFIVFFGCKDKEHDKTATEVQKLKFEIVENPTEPTELQQSEKENIANRTHSEFFKFADYKEYQLTDTISIDLNGNGINESIYFDHKDCPKILISESGKELISIGCGREEYKGLPNAVGWVDTWCVVSDKEVWEVLFKEDGDIDKDTIINLERPSIYIGKEEAGGGIITYRNGRLYWVHQSD
jgi:hypothetical protein